MNAKNAVVAAGTKARIAFFQRPLQHFLFREILTKKLHLYQVTEGEGMCQAINEDKQPSIVVHQPLPSLHIHTSLLDHSHAPAITSPLCPQILVFFSARPPSLSLFPSAPLLTPSAFPRCSSAISQSPWGLLSNQPDPQSTMFSAPFSVKVLTDSWCSSLSCVS